MDIFHVIRRPLVTEKSTHQARAHPVSLKSRGPRGGSYSFEVHPQANKADIKQAVEKIYSVRVVNVRTSVRMGKQRRYKFKVGETRGWKKAVVVLHPDYHIDLF